MSTAAPPEKPPDKPDREHGERYLTLVEHLQELRYRLTVSAIAVVAGLAVSAYFSNDLIYLLREPAGGQVLQAIEPFEKFVAYFRVALLGGLVFAMPVIVYQTLAFVAPGLTRRERQWLYGTVAGATFLFLGGVAFAYFVALPPALDFLFNFGSSDIETNIRIGSYIDFVTRLLFWTGVSFETPLVIMFLARFGMVNARQLISWWRLAIVAAFVIAAVVTPTIDPVTQSLVAGPIIVLYCLGIVLAFIVQPRERPDLQ